MESRPGSGPTPELFPDRLGGSNRFVAVGVEEVISLPKVEAVMSCEGQSTCKMRTRGAAAAYATKEEMAEKKKFKDTVAETTGRDGGGALKFKKVEPAGNRVKGWTQTNERGDTRVAGRTESTFGKFAYDSSTLNLHKQRDLQFTSGSQLGEDYVQLASDMMLVPTNHLGQYGHSKRKGNKIQSFPLELVSSLGYVASTARGSTILGKWSPQEISLFEAGMGHYGKDFHKIHKLIQGKSTKEVIDFYYIWKKTSHYKVWKKHFVALGELFSEEEYRTNLKKS